MKLINQDEAIRRAEEEFDGACISGCTAFSLMEDFEHIIDTTPVVVDTEDDEFTCLIMAAVRYCMGRRTYMPSYVTGYIKPLLSEVSCKLLFLLERDIKEQGKYGDDAYGDPNIDKPIWMGLYENVVKEISNRKMKGVWKHE